MRTSGVMLPLKHLLIGTKCHIGHLSIFPVNSHHLFWISLEVILIQFLFGRYSPEQLFAVVAAVDLYEDFLPWCQRSDIVQRYPDGSFDAELEIGFKFLVESYVSHVELKKPTYIKVIKFADTILYAEICILNNSSSIQQNKKEILRLTSQIF